VPPGLAVREQTLCGVTLQISLLKESLRDTCYCAFIFFFIVRGTQYHLLKVAVNRYKIKTKSAERVRGGDGDEVLHGVATAFAKSLARIIVQI